MERKKNNWLILALKVSVSLGLLYIVLAKAGLNDVLQTLKGLNIYYFLSASLLYILSIYVSSIRWALLLELENSVRLSVGRLFTLYMMGSFFNNLLPGIIGGDTVRVYYLYKESGRGYLSFGSVFADRWTGFAALVVIGLLAMIAGYPRIKGTGIEWVIPGIFLAFVVGSILVFRFRIGKKFSAVKGFYDYFLRLFSNRPILLKTLLLSVIIQIIIIYSVVLIAAGLKVETRIVDFFIIMPIIITITTIPVTLSGIGLREGSFVVLLGLTGINSEIATSISFGWFLSYILGSLPGAFFYLGWKRRRELEHKKAHFKTEQND